MQPNRLIYLVEKPLPEIPCSELCPEPCAGPDKNEAEKIHQQECEDCCKRATEQQKELAIELLCTQIEQAIEKPDFPSWIDKEAFRKKLADSVIMSAAIQLQQGGITVDGWVINNLTLEKSADERFIPALLQLQQGGITVDGTVINKLTPEKAADERFIPALLQLQQGGITVDGWVINRLTPEKAADEKFIPALIQLQQGGITVDGWVIDDLTPEKAADEKYLTILIAKEGVFSTADQEYIQAILEIDLSAISSQPEELLALRNDPRATPVAKQILTKPLRKLFLQSVKSMNDQHEEDPSQRLAVIKDQPAELLYETIVLGNEEVFTSTFNLIFDGNGYKGPEKEYALLPKMRQQYPGGGLDFLDAVDPNRESFRIFLRTCAQYGKLAKFLATIPSSTDREKLMQQFAGKLDQSKKPLVDAVTLGETLVYILKGQPEILKVLETKIQAEYQRLQTALSTAVDPTERKKIQATIDLYGFIASTHADTAVSQKEWFQKMRERYQLPDLSKIEVNELFIQDDLNIQQHFFYDDTKGGQAKPKNWDGHNSFWHFLTEYGGNVTWDDDGKNVKVSGKGRDGWQITDRDSYVLLEKFDEKSGKRCQIYANKPDREDAGVEAIGKEFENLKLDSIVVVHRGHSYHASKTIERIPAIACLVNLGSCGGFNNMAAVLSRAPRAHVLATKGTGSMFVNDYVGKQINEAILKGEALHWPTLWSELNQHFERQAKSGDEGDKKALDDFQAYIAPNQNIGAQIIRAYSERKKKLIT